MTEHDKQLIEKIQVMFADDEQVKDICGNNIRERLGIESECGCDLSKLFGKCWEAGTYFLEHCEQPERFVWLGLTCGLSLQAHRRDGTGTMTLENPNFHHFWLVETATGEIIDITKEQLGSNADDYYPYHLGQPIKKKII